MLDEREGAFDDVAALVGLRIELGWSATLMAFAFASRDLIAHFLGRRTGCHVRVAALPAGDDNRQRMPVPSTA